MVQIPPSAPNRESLECNSFRDFSYFTTLLSFSRCTRYFFDERKNGAKQDKNGHENGHEIQIAYRQT